MNVTPRPPPILQGSMGSLSEVQSLCLKAKLLKLSVTSSLQDGLQGSLSTGMHVLVASPPSPHHGGSVWPTEYGRSDAMWFLRLVHKKACGVPFLSVGSLALVETNCHVKLILRPLMEASLVLQDEELRPPDNNHVSEPSWKQIIQTQSSLQKTAAQASILTATSWETQLSHSQIPDAQKLHEIINVCYFKALSSGAICCAAIDN